MPKSVNKAILLGHVDKDPEIRSTNGGTISIATTERQKDGRGNWQDRTEWHNLVAFNRSAEVVRDYVRKGSQVLIEGKIQTRTWDDRESGQNKYRIEILVDDLTLLGGRSEDRGRDSGCGPGFARTGMAGAGQAQPANGEDYSDQGITLDDIPSLNRGLGKGSGFLSLGEESIVEDDTRPAYSARS
jgi:single-strand DNA-binding protein